MPVIELSNIPIQGCEEMKKPKELNGSGLT